MHGIEFPSGSIFRAADVVHHVAEQRHRHERIQLARLLVGEKAFERNRAAETKRARFVVASYSNPGQRLIARLPSKLDTLLLRCVAP